MWQVTHPLPLFFYLLDVTSLNISLNTPSLFFMLPHSILPLFFLSSLCYLSQYSLSFFYLLYVISLNISLNTPPSLLYVISLNTPPSHLVTDMLKPLEGLPLQIIIRMCTDEMEVSEYWHNINASLDLDMRVLDDVEGHSLTLSLSSFHLLYVFSRFSLNAPSHRVYTYLFPSHFSLPSPTSPSVLCMTYSRGHGSAEQQFLVDVWGAIASGEGVRSDGDPPPLDTVYLPLVTPPRYCIFILVTLHIALYHAAVCLYISLSLISTL